MSDIGRFGYCQREYFARRVGHRVTHEIELCVNISGIIQQMMLRRGLCQNIFLEIVLSIMPMWPTTLWDWVQAPSHRILPVLAKFSCRRTKLGLYLEVKEPNYYVIQHTLNVSTTRAIQIIFITHSMFLLLELLSRSYLFHQSLIIM